MNLKNRDFLKLLDYTPEEISALVELAADLKAKKKNGIPHRYCEGKMIALIFEKTSTRTRCAFEVAAHDLGMASTYLDPSGSQIGNKESIADTARVLAGMFDGIEYRGFGQEIVEDLAKYSSVPVWNGLTNEFHPTQMLADLLTIREHFGHIRGIRLSFFGDCRYNMANSWMVAGAKCGMHITLCGGKDYFPDEALTAQCRQIAEQTGGSITLEEDPEKGAKDADVLYTDVWVSMGEPMEAWGERIAQMKPYQVTEKLMSLASDNAIFMHCLPAFHDLGTSIGRQIHEKYGMNELEVTNAVFEGPQSRVFEEAENRMHTIKAVLAATLA
ncbi:MAG: ornithine carbamoyltransferase [Eubacteriales bacterium]|nr:ornithine carbamoyltransferase [Eubacteriales bacterium]